MYSNLTTKTKKPEKTPFSISISISSLLLFTIMQSHGGDGEVINKQVILKDYVTGGASPKESDLEVIANRTIKLNVPNGSHGVLLKNLYLSCDPYLLACMNKFESASIDIASFTPGSPIRGYGVGKILDSDHPKFKRGVCVGEDRLGRTCFWAN